MSDFEILNYVVAAIKEQDPTLTVTLDDSLDWDTNSMPMVVIFPIGSDQQDRSGDCDMETRSLDFGVSLAVASAAMESVVPYLATIKAALKDRYMGGLLEDLRQNKVLYGRGGGVSPFVQAELIYTATYSQEI